MTSIPRMSRMVKHLFEHDSVELARVEGLRQRNLTFVQLAFTLVLDWWNDLKRVELGNLCCSDLDHLYRELSKRRRELYREALQRGGLHEKIALFCKLKRPRP